MSQSGKPHHDSGLLIIGLIKIIEAALSIAAGMGVLHFLHKDLSDEILNFVRHLHLDEEGRLVTMLMDKIDLIDDHRLKQIGALAFAYGALKLLEGIGLMKQKVWAEYLTVCVSLAFLPWEIYEIIRHPNMWRVAILISNLLIVAYLIWLLGRMKRQRSLAAKAF